MNEIVQKNDPVLRLKALEVPIEEIGTDKINDCILRMKKALESQDDGVAIAAPQIGQQLRIFVISHRVFEMLDQEEEENIKNPQKEYRDMVFINPKITKISKDRKLMEEGCLSVRYLYGKVRRSTKAAVEAYDEHGKKFSYGGSGIIAQIFQHETDHLDGVLFTDKAQDIEDIPPEVQKERSRK